MLRKIQSKVFANGTYLGKLDGLFFQGRLNRQSIVLVLYHDNVGVMKMASM